MAESIDFYLRQLGDVYAPSVSKPSLQQWDNYQIYSLICVDYPQSQTYLDRGDKPIPNPYNYSYSIGNIAYYGNSITYGFPQNVEETYQVNSSGNGFLAYQQYGIDRPDFDFSDIAQQCIVKPRNIYSYKTYDFPGVSLGTYGARLEEYDFEIYRAAVESAEAQSDSGQTTFVNWGQSNTYYTAGGGYDSSYRNHEIKRFTYTTVSSDIETPNFAHLATSYIGDDRQRPSDNPQIKSSRSGKISIKYYRNNPYEPIPGLTSIDWFKYDVNIIADRDIYLPIINPVFGTVIIDGDPIVVAEVKNKLNSISLPANNYPYSYYFYSGNTPAVWGEWVSVYNSKILVSKPANNNNIIKKDYKEYEQPIFRKLAANNNFWGNDSTEYQDINGNSNHPMFGVEKQRAYDWHIKPQIVDGKNQGRGILLMDSIAIKNIEAALNATKWARNPDAPDNPRVWNLGEMIDSSAQVLGLRRKPDGTIDESLEKTTNRRQHVEGSESNDPQKFNPNCFGSEGTIVRHVPNRFSPDGKTVAGGYRKIKDIPQLLAELHEQAGAAMGYQDGTAIEIQVDGETYRYPNQLALLIELFVTLKQTQTYSKGAFFSSIIGEQSIKEVMSGLGLRTVDKFIEFNVAGKTAKLYYKGISASQSIRRKLSALATNIGITNGNIS